MHLIYPPPPPQKNILKNCITINIHIPSICKKCYTLIVTDPLAYTAL